MPAVAATFRLPPDRRWISTRHFHSDLHVVPDIGDSGADTTNSRNTLLLTFEGRAREGIAVALTDDAAPKSRRPTEIIFGDNGNTQTSLTSGKSKYANLGRVCRDGVWVSYWIAVMHNILYAGVIDSNGVSSSESRQRQCCVALLELSESEDVTEKAATDSNEGSPSVGESQPDDSGQPVNPSQSTATEPAKRAPTSAVRTFRYVGFRNSSHETEIRIRNIQLSTIATAAQTPPSTTRWDATLLPSPRPTEDTVLDMVILGEYEVDQLSATDCESIHWLCQYRAACQKARARAIKFNIPYQPPDLAQALPWSVARRVWANPTTASGFCTGLNLTSPDELAKQERRKARFGIPSNCAATESEAPITLETTAAKYTTNALPLEQAWDKIDLVGVHRINPPAVLWKVPCESTNNANEFRATLEPPTLSEEKIHLASIDWAAFKQIRSNDITAHFSVYGPTYVEWLEDLSCNVHFADKFSAARAIMSLSQDIPSPPPLTESNGGSSTNHSSLPDLGRMGWRFCISPIRKVSNDRHGKRGTEARVLMRVATSLDVLQERPKSWPAPPAGYCTNRILGPDSDLPQGSMSSKKRSKRESSESDTDVKNANGNNQGSVKATDAEAILGSGLSSSRAGFSVEEMEAERARKKAKAAS